MIKMKLISVLKAINFSFRSLDFNQERKDLEKGYRFNEI